jgi:hypothetical protein
LIDRLQPIQSTIFFYYEVQQVHLFALLWVIILKMVVTQILPLAQIV